MLVRRGWVGPGFPVYDGRIVIENPYEPKLYYDSAKPVRARVRVPSGLADRGPALQWMLRRAVEGGQEEAAKGRATEFRRADDSLVCDIDLGAHPCGIYSIELALRLEEEVVEEGPSEPEVIGRGRKEEESGEES